jgi:DNA (cytosine-5)-methyltransferase 1
MKKIRTYMSLFSSAGVGCYGFTLEGFECVATVELLEKRIDIQKYNNKCRFPTGYISGDIRYSEVQLKILDELELWKSSGKDELDVLIATPPCQGMSVANHKKGDEIKRNSLVVESIKITEKIKPKVFIYENVRSFLKTACTDTDGNIKPIEAVIRDCIGSIYNISSKVINFKDYGANSSRTRTLVIGVRKDIDFLDPNDLFPDMESEKTLYEVIGKQPKLFEMGEICSHDIYHAFRSYDERMRPWISGLGEGQTAFDNSSPKNIPHKIVDGKLVLNANKNGDKYKRQSWGKVAPCVHTRNDILASQNTVHPQEDRVFSIRELMLMMNIPVEFKWADLSLNELNNLDIVDKKNFLKKNELNIRHSIGEAVPTVIFKKIAKNIKKYI